MITFFFVAAVLCVEGPPILWSLQPGRPWWIKAIGLYFVVGNIFGALVLHARRRR